MISRRQFVAVLLTGIAAPLAAQGRASPVRMVLHRDPGCGCCLAWARIVTRAGYRVEVDNNSDMAAVKRRLGVPQSLFSCHTAVVDGLVIEGHVPMADIARLRRTRPAGIRGIAVPGMPVGSPGMEVPGVPAQPFRVMAFDANGRSRPFGG